MTYRDVIVDEINRKIEALGIKRKFLANKIDIPEDRLSRILSKKSNMFAEEMLLLCVALDIDPKTLKKPA